MELTFVWTAGIAVGYGTGVVCWTAGSVVFEVGGWTAGVDVLKSSAGQLLLLYAVELQLSVVCVDLKSSTGELV